jgi:hypothetical protein
LLAFAFGDVVDGGSRFKVAGPQHVGSDIGLGRRGDEADPGGDHRGQVRIGDQLRVADQQEAPLAGEAGQCFHGGDDLGDLPGSAVIGIVPERHGAIRADRQAGLDLLQIRAPVLGVPKARFDVVGVR